MAGHTRRRRPGTGRGPLNGPSSIGGGVRVLGAVVRQEQVALRVEQDPRDPKLLLRALGIDNHDSGAKPQVMGDLLEKPAAAHQ